MEMLYTRTTLHKAIALRAIPALFAVALSVAAPLAAGTTEPSASVHALGSSSVLAPAEVDASFILDKPTLVLGEPVWLTFRLTNRSTVQLRFVEAADRGSVLDNEYTFR